MNPENAKQGPSFRPWCVRALAAGDKTQTRRRVDLPEARTHWDSAGMDGYSAMFVDADSPGGSRETIDPIYQPGEVYYVREALEVYTNDVEIGPNKGTYHTMVYSADTEPVRDGNGRPLPWRKRNGEPYQVDKLSARYMRKEAARYFSRITDVWVEEYGEISAEDAWAEGIEHHPDFTVEDIKYYGADVMFNEVVLPGIHDEVPDWLFAYQFEVLTREEVEEV